MSTIQIGTKFIVQKHLVFNWCFNLNDFLMCTFTLPETYTYRKIPTYYCFIEIETMTYCNP